MHLRWSVGGLPYQSYPVACVKARDFVVNACTEGEGYRFSIRAAHWHTQMDGGRGRRKAAQLKRVFSPSPVRIARSLVALASSAAPPVAPSSPFLTRSDFSRFRKAGSLARRCEAHTPSVTAVTTRYPYNHLKDHYGEGISLYELAQQKRTERRNGGIPLAAYPRKVRSLDSRSAPLPPHYGRAAILPMLAGFR